MAYTVLSVLLRELSTFLREEGALLGGLQGEVQLIKDELGQMKDFLRHAEAKVEENGELEAWVSQVRDVSYDVEDVLDEFMLRFGRHYGDGFLARVQKVYGSIKNLKARHQLATNIRTINRRIRNISEAHKRYQNQFGNSDQGSSSAAAAAQNTWYDSRSDALLLDEAELVGIERPKKKLMNMLLTNDSQLHVISIVGMGGLGKTTLVKKVYDDADIKNRFKHHAWITVSQSFRTEALLKQAIQQLSRTLKQPAPAELDTMDINTMKQVLHNLLRQENYIVVFDDIWRTTDWDAIRMAFPKNNCGSRIIITSRNAEVGQAAMSGIAGDIYPLEPLTKEESWTLFCKKVFRATSCPHHLEKIAGNIIERCAGLPLGIMVIGGVLATKACRTEEWDVFNRSLGEQLAGNNQLDNMTKLLSLSYYDLPDHLRICLLYLSILPEDVKIRTGSLIRLWIAEGFVQEKEGMTMEEVGEGYLNDLINRSLVQVPYTRTDGRVIHCRLHDIIHQIVNRKAREQDITTICSEQGMQFSCKVRRLISHDTIYNTQVSNRPLKCIRSLVLFKSFGCDVSKPLLCKLLSSNLRLLKVLELRGAPLDVIPDDIFKLFHLKYLSLAETAVETVPKSIGKLQKLQTLDLVHAKVRELPIEILELQQLRHLLVVNYKDEGFLAPAEIGNLQSLQSLWNIYADQKGNIKIVKEIGKLTQLRDLRITKLRREDGKELCSSLEKLTNLRLLRVTSIHKEEFMDLQYSLSSTPQFLHTLTLRGRLEKVPQWIPSLHGLTSIYFSGSRLRDDSLQLLQDLPNLMELALKDAYEGEGLYFKAGGFQRLKNLKMWELQQLRWMRVEKGAMPFLQELHMGCCDSLKELPMGIQHLISLQSLQIDRMPQRFEEVLEDLNRENYKKIAHIPRVRISTSASEATFSMGTRVSTKKEKWRPGYNFKQ